MTDYCITFDVVSLFTNVPLNETIQMIANGVRDSTIPQPNMLNLLKSVTGGLFQYNKKLYSFHHIIFIYLSCSLKFYSVFISNSLADTTQ